MSSTGPDIDARIAATAADWLARVQSEDATGDDWLALEAWLAEAPEHRAAFERAELLWSTLDEDRAEIAAGLAPDEPSGDVVDLTARRPGGRRLGWTAPLGAVAAVLIAAVVGLWVLRAPPMQVYSTAPGQTRTIRLDDGSTIALNGGSTVRVRLDSRQRRVVMEHAEAAFDVSRDPARPFTVEAGDRQVRVVGTQFNVRHDPAAVVVTVRRGVVQVSGRGGGDPVRLTPGTQLTQLSGAATPVVRTVSVDDAFAWQAGRVVARDRRLGDVVADLNRQLARPIGIEGAAAEIRFTGVIAVSDRDAAVRDLEALLPVRATREGQEIRLVSR